MITAKALQRIIIFIALEPFKLRWYQRLKMRVGSPEISLKTVGKSYYLYSFRLLHSVTEDVNRGGPYRRDLGIFDFLAIAF